MRRSWRRQAADAEPVAEPPAEPTPARSVTDTLEEARACARGVVADEPVEQVMRRDQATAQWKERLSALGVDPDDDAQMLGLVAGLTVARLGVEMVCGQYDDDGVRVLYGELQGVIIGAQTLLLNMQKTPDLPGYDIQEGMPQ